MGIFWIWWNLIDVPLENMVFEIKNYETCMSVWFPHLAHKLIIAFQDVHQFFLWEFLAGFAFCEWEFDGSKSRDENKIWVYDRSLYQHRECVPVYWRRTRCRHRSDGKSSCHFNWRRLMMLMKVDESCWCVCLVLCSESLDETNWRHFRHFLGRNDSWLWIRRRL